MAGRRNLEQRRVGHPCGHIAEPHDRRTPLRHLEGVVKTVLLDGDFDQRRQRRLQIARQAHHATLPYASSLGQAADSRVNGGLALFFFERIRGRIRQCIDQLLRLLVVFILHRLRYQHARRHFAHGGLGARSQAPVVRIDRRTVFLPFAARRRSHAIGICAFGLSVKRQGPVETHRQNASELIACGIFAHGVDGIAKTGVVAPFAHKAIGLALDGDVLLLSDVFLKRQQRVRVGFQQARKRGDQRDIG